MANKIRVLVADDEPLARRGVRQLLQSEPDFEVVGEAGNGLEAAAAVEKLAPDLVFLDIQMPVLDGFSFVERIAGGGGSSVPEIVFVTAYDEHAIRAFEAGAIDYVLKPTDPERFRKTLERVRRRFVSGETRSLESKLENLLLSLRPAGENYPERIAVKENERIRFLEVEKIDWIGSQGNYVEIHSAAAVGPAGGAGKFLVRETMDGIERKLDPRSFLRIRRSAIVRIGQIKELRQLFGGEYEVVLHSGAKLISSRRYRKNLEILLRF